MEAPARGEQLSKYQKLVNLLPRSYTGFKAGAFRGFVPKLLQIAIAKQESSRIAVIVACNRKCSVKRQVLASSTISPHLAVKLMAFTLFIPGAEGLGAEMDA